MKKNSDFKNISYTNYEMISMFITILSCFFVSYSPIRIIEICGSSSVIGILFVCLVSFIIYFLIVSFVFKNEFDFLEMIKKTYPKIVQKILGIIIYVFAILYSYILISNLLYNLKASIYTKSTIFSLAIFFIVAMYILAKKGFNTIFRIVGYISYIIIIYIIFLLFMSIYRINIFNFVPIMGEGWINLFGTNLLNIGIFAPLIFFLFFGGKVVKTKKRNNKKNFSKIMIIFGLTYSLLMFTFIGTIPIELISSKYTLMLDLSSLISISPITLKLTPIMIFVFSFIIFISSAFCILCGLYSTERLNIVKDYSKYILPTILIISIIFYIEIPLSTYNIIVSVFYAYSIFITFIFPIITLIIYKIRNKGGNRRFEENEKMENIIEEVN